MKQKIIDNLNHIKGELQVLERNIYGISPYSRDALDLLCYYINQMESLQMQLDDLGTKMNMCRVKKVRGYEPDMLEVYQYASRNILEAASQLNENKVYDKKNQLEEGKVVYLADVTFSAEAGNIEQAIFIIENRKEDPEAETDVEEEHEEDAVETRKSLLLSWAMRNKEDKSSSAEDANTQKNTVDWDKYNAEQKKLYSNHGKAWDKDEEDLLKILFVEYKCPVDVLTRVFKRNSNAIEKKLERMELG